MKILNSNGELVEATYIQHLRTLTPRSSMGGANRDLDLFRLEDGTEVVAESLSDDARDIPFIRNELTAETVLFIE